MIKKILPLLSFMILYYAASSQMVLQDPVSARTFNTEKYAGYEGSPFLFNDKWTAGNVTILQGTYKSLELKLDVYNDVLFFKRNDEPYEFQDEVVSFVLMPKIADSTTWMYFKRGLSGVGLKPQQYVQVLAEGPVSLYRSDIRSLSDVNQINRGIIKTFTPSVRYFVSRNGTLQLLKPTKKEILEVLNDKAAKVEAFINEQKVSFKKDADLGRVFKYYNTL
jgi:hypothetical protein